MRRGWSIAVLFPGALFGVRSLVYASPPDPTWISGVCDVADCNEAVIAPAAMEAARGHGSAVRKPSRVILHVLPLLTAAAAARILLSIALARQLTAGTPPRPLDFENPSTASGATSSAANWNIAMIGSQDLVGALAIMMSCTKLRALSRSLGQAVRELRTGLAGSPNDTSI